MVNYEKYRPTYVDELFRDVISYAKLDHTKNALEIGIGTGQATLPILQTGCHLTAIELGANMAAYSKNKFACYDNFKVINLDFESFCPGTKRFNLIYSATAFHWIPEQIGFPKVFDLLKPRGVVALFWNHASRDPGALHCEMQKAYAQYRPSSEKPKFAFDENSCQKYIDLLNQYGFINVTAKLYHQTRIFNANEYISLLNTYSDHRAMEHDAKVGLENAIAAAINKFGGQIDIRDTMDLYLGTKP